MGELLLCYKLLQESFYLYIIHQILIQHILVFSFLLEKSIMDGVYVIFILVEHHLSSFFYFYILEELCFMVHTFIIQILGFLEFFFSFSIFSRMDLWRILCSQSNIEEVLSLSFSTPISSLWFSSSSSFLSSFSIF